MVSGSGNATVTASAFEGSVKQMIASSEKDGNSIPPDKKRSIYLAATSRQHACHVAADSPAPDRIMPACEKLGSLQVNEARPQESRGGGDRSGGGRGFSGGRSGRGGGRNY